MSIGKRLRILLAVFRQEWHTFICPGCRAVSYISGHYPDLRGLLCEECEGREFDKWLADFRQRDAKGV